MTADPPYVVLSPHYDDAALSAHALLTSGEVGTVLTVCSAAAASAVPSYWDKKCGFRSPAQAIEVRQAEDRVAMADLRVATDRVGLVDGAYLTGPRPDEERVRLVQRLNELFDGVSGSVRIAAPVGAGRPRRHPWRAAAVALRLPGRVFFDQAAHPDHVWVRDSALSFARDTGCAVALYEDLPYALGNPADPVAAELGRLWGARVELAVTAVDLAAKVRAVGCYASQLPGLFPHWALRDLAAALPATERTWTLTFDN